MRDYYGANWGDPALHNPWCDLAALPVYHRDYCKGSPFLNDSCLCGASRTAQFIGSHPPTQPTQEDGT